MEPMDNLSEWNLDTELAPNGYEMESLVVASNDNFRELFKSHNALIDRYNELALAFNSLLAEKE